MSDTEVVLTIPASFDELAKSLTLEAAKAAGLAEPRLLEEPQAAFYAWLERHKETWRGILSAGDAVLVADIGGGTTDFSLISVKDNDGDLGLERVALGRHILLGGDNMDLLLAHILSEDQPLSEHEFGSLVHEVRKAKERILRNIDIEKVEIRIPKRGAMLVGRTLEFSLTREAILRHILEGFFPLTGFEEAAEGKEETLKDFSLAYEENPSVSYHLGSFLKAAAKNAGIGEGFAKPRFVLFNGGVFNSGALRQRFLDVLREMTAHEAEELPAADLDLAVSYGALSFGLLEAPLRIRSGTLRSYYLGFLPARPAVPGYKPKMSAICLIPQGAELGDEFAMDTKVFSLKLGDTARFQFFSSLERRDDRPQDIIGVEGLDESGALRVALTPQSESHHEGDFLSVVLESKLEENGVLGLFLKDRSSDARWRLEYRLEEK